MNKREVRLGVLLGFILFIIPLSYFLLSNPQSSRRSIPTPLIKANRNIEPPKIDTLNWNTYRNTKYNYEFSYPLDMEMDRLQGSSLALSDKELAQLDGVSIGKLISNEAGITIAVNAESTNQDILQNCHDSIIEDVCLKDLTVYRTYSGYNPPLPAYKILMINDVPAIQFDSPILDRIYTTTMIVKNGALITIEDSTYGYDPDTVSGIVSTFRFLD